MRFSFHVGYLGLPPDVEISVPHEIMLSTPMFSTMATVVAINGETVTLEVNDERMEHFLKAAGPPSAYSLGPKSSSWD